MGLRAAYGGTKIRGTWPPLLVPSLARAPGTRWRHPSWHSHMALTLPQ